METAPGYASGDLRKSQQLANAEAAETGICELAFLEVAYLFCHQVLSARWPQVQALAVALLARGTIDGNQLEALLERQRRARERDDWLHVLVGWPLLFGGVWAAFECPSLGTCVPGGPTAVASSTGSRYSL